MRLLRGQLRQGQAPLVCGQNIAGKSISTVSGVAAGKTQINGGLN